MWHPFFTSKEDLLGSTDTHMHGQYTDFSSEGMSLERVGAAVSRPIISRVLLAYGSEPILATNTVSTRSTLRARNHMFSWYYPKALNTLNTRVATRYNG